MLHVFCADAPLVPFATLRRNCYLFGLRPVLLAVISGCCLFSSAVAQSAGDPPNELVDGLLELLSEPSPADATIEPGASLETPINRRVDPLAAVGQKMTASADLLGRGRTDRETQQLQGEIVRQLDELIAGMESADPRQPQSNSQNPEPQSGQTTETASTNAGSSQRPSPSGSSPGTEKSGDATRSTRPGQSGAAARAVVEFVDPRELQQSVWGQLPERMRKQMQSRMVEQFLPSYREEIEGYFQALLSETGRDGRLP